MFNPKGRVLFHAKTLSLYIIKFVFLSIVTSVDIAIKNNDIPIISNFHFCKMMIKRYVNENLIQFFVFIYSTVKIFEF